MNKLILAAAIAGAATLCGMADAQAVDVDNYIKRDSFSDIKISPNGDYYAATVLQEDRTSLAILSRETGEVTGSFTLERNKHVIDFDWVNPERVVISTAQKFGLLAQPLADGNLYAIDADGSNPEILVGQSVGGNGLGTRIQPKKVERVAAFLVDDLPEDDTYVVVSATPFNENPYTRADRLDVNTGRRSKIATSPVRNATLTTDNEGEVRFALGAGVDNVSKLYYRAASGADWELIRDEAVTRLIESPLGFSRDNSLAYFRAERARGPDAIVAYDVGNWTDARELARDDRVDPYRVIYRNNSHEPVGVMYMDGRPRTVFFDPQSTEARLYKSLEAAFQGQAVVITSRSDDDRYVLAAVWSDTSPGDYFLYDTVEKKAEHVLSRAQWIDPAAMAATRPVTIPARDGLQLHGYLTVPRGSDGRGLPTIVLPHGGPYYVRDTWGFDPEVQLLADAGYAVLRVNFRGSQGYGKAFEQAGVRQWGLAMQDDLTDATRWAIEQGHADPARICLYGASYGAYASLMGVAKEPDLYRCAAGYVGVYDLPVMQGEDASNNRRLGNWSRDWVGDDTAALAAASPNRIAQRIKVPVFLAAGKEDEVAPPKHTELMEKALKEAGVAVEASYFSGEGHGFYKEENKREYYTGLLAFLARHLGGEVATAAAGGAADTGK
ncbi:prolyl oligopeptidase family serine peptidase [Lysobacter maris]|uniref:Prolyl oligopeptidase family serine peptidase n=1 Tax=Marilutibacter maris TaxID=1605891 RepID=A0A508B515_9GAMM|nr:S9 family peptidase [Lysobacter maris]KAB8198508.1 prolyl oligopeptidase family serine peptidase [Lysobacter maris]